jgi:hypothetical protein
MQSMKRYTMLVAVAFLAACGGDDDKNPAGPGNGGGEEVVGNFTATLAGDVAASLSGEAAHASVSQGESQGFVLALDDEANGAQAGVIFVRANPAIPGTGAHDIVGDAEEMGDDDFAVIAAVTDAAGAEWLCYGIEGTLNVTSSSTARVRGNFTVSGACVSAEVEEEQAITFSGTYDSRGGNVSPTIRAAVARAERQ